MASIKGVTLFEGEGVVYQTKPSWLRWTWSIVIGLATCWLLVGLWPLWRSYRARSGAVYAVTTDRVIEKSGNRNVSVSDYRIDDIAEVRTSQSRKLLLFSMGTVIIDIQHGNSVKLKGLSDPSAFVAAIRGQQ